MGIQVFKPKFDVEDCLSEIRECLEAGWPGIGFKTLQFEEDWKKYTGHSYAYYTNSGTAALHLAIHSLKMLNGWENGDEVISTPFTFVSTNHAALYEGLKVCFADIDEFMCMDPKSLEERITPKTRAVIFVGYGGRIGRLKEIINICKRNDLKLILDAAHMSGTRVNGITPGTWDGVDVATYSFHAVKNLPTGDSGMVCFRSAEADKIARTFAWLGANRDTYSRNKDGKYSWKYNVECIGYKYSGNSVMASLGIAQLKHLDEDNERRRQIAAIYDRELVNNDGITIVPTNHGNEANYHIYAVLTPYRDELLQYLAENGIGCSVHYTINTEYSMYEYARGTCPQAELASKTILTLPMHMWLSDDDVVTVTKAINDFFTKRGTQIV